MSSSQGLQSIYVILCMHECLHGCVRAPFVSGACGEEKRVGVLGTGVSGDCEPPDMRAGA